MESSHFGWYTFSSLQSNSTILCVFVSFEEKKSQICLFYDQCNVCLFLQGPVGFWIESLFEKEKIRQGHLSLNVKGETENDVFLSFSVNVYADVAFEFSCFNP